MGMFTAAKAATKKADAKGPEPTPNDPNLAEDRDTESHQRMAEHHTAKASHHDALAATHTKMAAQHRKMAEYHQGKC